LGRRKALGMLLETLDAEEFFEDGLFVIPWRSPRGAPERAKNRQFQVCAMRVDGARAQRGKRFRARIPVAEGVACKGWGIAFKLLIF
jgi:hypothetical protein